MKERLAMASKIEFIKLIFSGAENTKRNEISYLIDVELSINGNKHIVHLEGLQNKSVFSVNPIKIRFLDDCYKFIDNYDNGTILMTFIFYKSLYKSYSEYKFLDVYYSENNNSVISNTFDINSFLHGIPTQEIELGQKNKIKFNGG